MATKTFLLSGDMAFRQFLSEEMAKLGRVVDASVYSFAGLQGRLRPGDFNVLILDTDTVIVPEGHLKNIVDKQMLEVVLIGVKNAATYLLAGFRGAMAKPAADTTLFAKKVFVRNVADRVDIFERVNTLPSAADAIHAAGIRDKVLVFAASTGGTEALNLVMSALPARVPPTLIVQHMPDGFTQQFAQRLDRNSKFSVKEAARQDFAKANHALIAPGDMHMKAVNRGGKLFVECFKGERLHGVRPAADILLDSLAEMMGPNVIGVVLTGMGTDGAKGMFKLKKKGAIIIGQDEASCVVYGMPKAVADLGILNYQLPLDKIAGKISELI